jgi:hypothetical protein
VPAGTDALTAQQVFERWSRDRISLRQCANRIDAIRRSLDLTQPER